LPKKRKKGKKLKITAIKKGREETLSAESQTLRAVLPIKVPRAREGKRTELLWLILRQSKEK